MSFPALSTAMLLASAPVPPVAAPVAAPALVVDAAVIAQEASATDPSAALPEPAPIASETSQPAAAQPPPSTGSVQPTEAVPPPEPTAATEPADQSPNPLAVQEEIIVTGRSSVPEDPLQALNAEAYEITQKVDEAFVAPVAFAYKDVLPSPLRRGIRNFLNNLSEPIVFLNFLLQLKPGKAAETFARFAINTTIGGAGLVDVAKRKPFKLPYRNNGFANTLGYYGVGTGPYFYLPLIGSTSLRDFIGNRVDQILLPMALGPPFNRPEFAIPAAVLNELDDRIEFDDELSRIRATRDPYVASREYYLKRRQAEIDALHGWGDSTIRVIVPDPPDTEPAPAATSAAPEAIPESRFTRH